MAVLPLKQPDDNDYLRYTGANYMKLTSDYYSNASWDEGKTFRNFYLLLYASICDTSRAGNSARFFLTTTKG